MWQLSQEHVQHSPLGEAIRVHSQRLQVLCVHTETGCMILADACPSCCYAAENCRTDLQSLAVVCISIPSFSKEAFTKTLIGQGQRLPGHKRSRLLSLISHSQSPELCQHSLHQMPVEPPI